MEKKTQTPHAIYEAVGSIERIEEAAQTLNWESLTQTQAALRLGVSKATVSAWIRRGQVLTATAGSIPFIPLREVTRLEKVVAGEAKHIKHTQ